ncbi:thioredoxin reductase [Methanothermus fervidus DSM 2088]|uniref:Thioredoxin reductase n=1 Tax=Methanothermus fervidus (strain ATCC 43054 / DSM 2088 / JCM 10308 / V24 S) TaxID=523846 RepID=E3GYC7_METFV|nr:thioredoxin reductase [Methanothermus fervidus DSM 2088]
MRYDIIVVGAGPAGLTAGLYGGRQGDNVLILEKGRVGGKGLEIPYIENYPGYKKVKGMVLIEKMKEQVSPLVDIKELEEVKSIKHENSKFIVTTTKNKYLSKAVILATGTTHRELNVPGEKEFKGRGVSYCAICDGPLYINKNILVVGGGNSAVQEAIYLKSIGCKVKLVHRRNKLRAEKYLQKKLKDLNIPVIWDSVVEKIRGNNSVEEVVLYNKKTKEKKIVEVDGVFIAIGEIPLNKLARDLGVKLDKRGYVMTDEFQRTNVQHVYAAGDITHTPNQWIVACSEGAIAALTAHNDLLRGQK